MEPYKLNDTFRQEVEKQSEPLFEMDLNAYLKESLESDKENKDGCKGWEYLKTNLTKELRQCLVSPEYWALKYNADKLEWIIKKLGAALDAEEKHQLDAFVYVWNSKMQDSEEQERRQGLLNQNYEEINSTQKELDGVKVNGIFSLNYTGILGTDTKNVEQEGKLVWVERLNCLMLMPKGSRTRGYPIRDKAYIKRVI